MTRRTPEADRSVNWRRGGLVYYTETAEGEEYERIYRHDIHSEQDLLVLDPNQLAAGRPYLEVGLIEPSPDGRLLAYSVDLTGSELYELRFRDLSSGEDLPDVIDHSYYSGAWSADSGSFFYTVTDDAYRPDRIRRHVLGADPSLDETVLEEADRRFELELAASRDGGWVVITAGSRDTTEVRLISANAPAEAPRLVCPRRRGVEYAVQVLPGGWSGSAADDRLLLVTDDGEPEFRLVEAPLPGPGESGDESSWQTVDVAPAAKGERLVSAAVFAGHVVLELRRDVEPFLRVLPRSHAPGPDLGLELHCSVPFGQLRLWRPEEFATSTVTVVEQNLVSPPTWFEVELDTGARRQLKRTEVPGADLSRYASSRIEAPGRDGVLVPVSIAHLAGQNAGAPGLLYGYGAYESCEWPAFDVGTLSLLDRGVVHAVAHVRGGGERGRAWWQDGRLRTKQHTFDDFVAARDALVEQGWLAADRVASRGLSAGGLLQGAVFSQAPDRWRAVVAEVPFVDVVTSMSDPQIPLTVNEWDEWGDPLHDPGDFAAMLAYSPYDHPPLSARPALLVTGALHDPRVLVREPAKWVARLRATDPGSDPRRLLFRVELGEGAHVGPSGRLAHLGYEAEILAWILARLGVE
jgi:oligopeptidase B